MQMDAVIASVLPFVGPDGREEYRDDPRRRRSPDVRPDFDGATHKSLAEIYANLKLDSSHVDPVSDRHSMVIDRSQSVERRNVDVRICYLNFSRVDTRNQRFDAEIFLQASWEEPRLNGKSAKYLEDFVIEGYWEPHLYITNLARSPDREEKWCTVVPHEPHPIVVWKMRIKGTFNERLELEDFPFDVQELQIQVASRLMEDQVALRPDPNRLSTCNKHNMVDQSEWVLYNHVESSKGVIRAKLPTAKHHHPCINFSCSARRNPTFYIVNIFFMMFLLCSLVFCTAGIPARDYLERLKINIVLLLSVVAMKYVATNFYPVDLAYLTYMDVYNLLCVGVVTLMAIQNSILSIFENDANTLAQVDNGSLYFVAVVFLLIQLISFTIAILAVVMAKHAMRKKDQEYRRKEIELMKPKTQGGQKNRAFQHRKSIPMWSQKISDSEDDDDSRRGVRTKKV